jgi:hypothetical protein
MVGVELQAEGDQTVDLAQAGDVGDGVVRHDRGHREKMRKARDRGRARQLALHLAQEHLLPHDAREVAVLVVAEAHKGERLVAVQNLVARLDVDRSVVCHGGVVVVAMIDHEVGPTQLVDDLDEAFEVDVDEVVDGNAEQLLDRLDGQLGAAQGVGRVDLVQAEAGDVDPQVARHGEHRDAVGLRIETHDHERV